MEINIIPIRNKKNLMKFIKFPFTIYKGNDVWVPPLISEMKNFLSPEKNPFHEHSEVELFLAERNNKIVGRIAAILNHRHVKIHKEKVGFFGFYEAVNEYEVSQILFDTVKDWLKTKGIEVMRGPANFSQNDTCGLLIDGFQHSPVVMMPYNPEYYKDHIEKYGFQKAMDLWAYYLDGSIIPERLKGGVEKVKKNANIRIRPINMKKYDSEVEIIKDLYNSAWEENWGFVPMTDDEFYHLAKSLKTVIEPDFVLIGEVSGVPAGFSLALPDVNQAIKRTNGRLFPLGLFKLLWYSRKIDFLRVIVMGVKKEFRKIGVDTLFYGQTYQAAIRKGYKAGELSWILENNLLMNKVLENLKAKVYKTYRMYDYKIE